MLLFLFLFGLALGAVSPSDDPQVLLQQGSCTAGQLNHNGRCYNYIATQMTWADAEFHCVSQGANLVSIHSLDEHIFVKALIKNYDPANGRTWIGLSDIHKEGRWMWSDGSTATFFDWTNGQPDNKNGVEDCVDTNYSGANKWNDERCSSTYPFVCASRCP